MNQEEIIQYIIERIDAYLRLWERGHLRDHEVIDSVVFKLIETDNMEFITTAIKKLPQNLQEDLIRKVRELPLNGYAWKIVYFGGSGPDADFRISRLKQLYKVLLGDDPPD